MYVLGIIRNLDNIQHFIHRNWNINTLDNIILDINVIIIIFVNRFSSATPAMSHWLQIPSQHHSMHYAFVCIRWRGRSGHIWGLNIWAALLSSNLNVVNLSTYSNGKLSKCIEITDTIYVGKFDIELWSPYSLTFVNWWAAAWNVKNLNCLYRQQ